MIPTAAASALFHDAQTLTLPNYRVRLLYDNSIITSQYYEILAQSMHERHMEEYILHNTKWPRHVLLQVDWLAHE
jgi:hypothetical protein